jgi:branched-chain amino acid transport system permease protein
MNYLLHILIMINIYIILTLGLNLLVGYSNLLSIAHAAFYGIGAYLSVLALVRLNLTLIPAVLLAVAGTALLAYVIGKISIRLKGDYFVLVTLGFQMIVYAILYNWVNVTRGPYGIPGIPSPRLLGIFEIKGIIGFLVLSCIFVGIIVFIYYRIIHSPFGRILKGIRDDEVGVSSLGRDVAAYKTLAFVIGSAVAAVSGFLFASYVSYIDPTSFTLDESIFIVTAVLIGGAGTIKGSIAGAVFVQVLPEMLRFLGMPDSIAANMRQVIYGSLLVAFMIFRPKGLWGDYEIQ